jgi:hypothetical protein
MGMHWKMRVPEQAIMKAIRKTMGMQVSAVGWMWICEAH